MHQRRIGPLVVMAVGVLAMAAGAYVVAGVVGAIVILVLGAAVAVSAARAAGGPEA